jgi:hypothetical protein
LTNSLNCYNVREDAPTILASNLLPSNHEPHDQHHPFVL